MPALLHRLLPATPDVEAYHQGTLLVAACFLTGLFSVGYAVLDAAVGYWVGTAVMSVVAVLFFVLPPLFRWTGSVELVAHLFLFIGTATVLSNAHFAGGAEVLPWLAVVPIAGVLLTGRRGGAAWTVVAMTLAATFALLEARGYAYAVETNLEERPAWVVLVRVGLPLIVFLLARVFHDEKERALAKIQARRAELEAALERLEAAQDKLVQQEKLAALGQVTAGIAHEIKNPLNFVTNFAELNHELAGDLRAALAAGDVAEADAIAAEVGENAARVREHGQRADAIVRSMLAHARAERGPRRRTDLNALVAQSVALAVRAQGPGRPVAVEEAYDDAAGPVEVDPDEIGRAVLNVIENALWAAREAAPRPDGPPRVRVETHRAAGGVEVRVRDNGAGMPPAVRERVFEPFFTTKPAGEGTGLGLSLGFDIVETRHGGTLAVESVEGVGTLFTLSLPAACSSVRVRPEARGTACLGPRPSAAS